MANELYIEGIKVKHIGIGIIVLAIALLLFNSFTVVGTGNKGIIKVFGKVNENKILDEGIHIVNPIAQIVEINVRRQKESIDTSTYTKDVQTATLKLVVTYSLNKQGVAKLYKYIGNDWKAKLVTPIINTASKNVVGQWEADKLVENRAKASEQIKQSLIKLFNKNYINFDSFDLLSIDYSDAFEKSIEEKQIATQNAIKEKNNTVKVQEIANQKIITAQAEAKAMRIKAQALTQNKSLIEYEAVKKWDGKLPTTTSGVMPFIKIGK